MGLVKCPNCRKCYHETTENYNPDARANGSMVRLMDPWRSWGWTPFGGEDNREIKFAESAATLASDMICPQCGAQLAPSGRLMVIEEPKQEPQDVKEKIKSDVTKKELVASMIAEGKPWKEMLKESGLGFKELSSLVKEVQGNA